MERTVRGAAAAVFAEDPDRADPAVFRRADVFAGVFVRAAVPDAGSGVLLAIYRPYDFSILSAFAAGVFLDFLDGTPLGINTLVFTLFYLTAGSQRRFLAGRPFSFVWFGFAVFSAGACFLKWLFVSINYAVFTPVLIAFISYLLLLLCYPLVSWPCAKLHVYLSDREK